MRIKVAVISVLMAPLLLLAGRIIAYRLELIEYPVPPEWVTGGVMALHILSPDEMIHGMPIIRLIFDPSRDVYNPEAQADVALAYGADINAKDQKGWTALMEGARYGGSLSVAYLTSHGANTEIEDNDGNTALLLADDNADGWPFSISGLLLAARADPCHKNHKGETPAMHFGLDTPLGRMLDEVCKEKTAAK